VSGEIVGDRLAQTRTLQYRPQTEAAMLDISGVGQTKLDRYGGKFLEIIREQ